MKNTLVFFCTAFFHCVEIGAVDQRRGDAEARQPILDHPAAGAEQRLGGDDMVAGLHQAHQRGRHGRHAGRGRARGFGAFERRHALLEHAHGRVGVARIDVARDLAGKARLALLGASVDIALREEQRLGGFAELRAQRAGMHQAGFGAVVLVDAGIAASLGWRMVIPKAGIHFRDHTRGQQKTGRRKISAGLTRPRPFSDLFYVAASRPAQMTTG